MRLDWILAPSRDTVPLEVIQEQTVFHYSIPLIEETGDGAYDNGASIASAKQRVVGGELLISRLNPRKSRVLITEPHEGLSVCSGEFVVMKPRSEVELPFLRYRLLAETTRCYLDANVRSVTRSQQRVDPDVITKMWLELPAPDQQRRIATFLDAEGARVDELIAEQQGLIRLLDEHRFAAVSEALQSRVGGGPGDLESAISPLPSSWRLTPLRFVAEIQSGVTLGKKYEGTLEERPYLRVANVLDGGLDLDDVTTIAVPREVAQRHELCTGDVLMTEGGDNDKLGRGAVWDGQIGGCLHQNHVFAVRPRQSALRPHFLAAMMGSAWGRAYFTGTAHQTTNLASTNRSKVGRFPIPLPPVTEQDSLLAGLRLLFERLDETTLEARHQIALLREHRQALITAAVTGGLEAVGRVA